MHSDVDSIVKRDHIARAHPNAAEAGRFPNAMFLRCAVNVDATIVRRAISSFHPAEPDDARHDCVPARDVHAHDFARWNPFLDNRTGGQFVAEFAGNKRVPRGVR